MKRRLSVENRMLIEQLLRLNYKLRDIAYYVDSTSSTVSREIKNRRITGKGDFKECNKTKRFPYVCNGCNIKTYCRKKKYYYNYIKAQKNYNYLLEKSRIGIDMSIDEIDYWNDYFKDKIKERCDYVEFDGLNFTCFEIKVSKADYLSNAVLSKFGQRNYIVAPKDLADWIKAVGIKKKSLGSIRIISYENHQSNKTV